MPHDGEDHHQDLHRDGENDVLRGDAVGAADCTNFASQCVYAGSGVMNYEKDFGWYYIDANNKAPAWTGVEYFYRFMTREAQNPGPVALNASISQLELGDVVQLSFDGENWNHSPVVVRLLRRPALRPADDVLVVVERRVPAIGPAAGVPHCRGAVIGKQAPAICFVHNQITPSAQYMRER